MIRQGYVSSAELIELHLERIAEINPVLNAAIDVLDDSAREAAQDIDRRRARGESLGPLAGVPFSIKDSIEVQGTVCTAGTLGLHSAARSARDAAVVSRLRAAGVIPLARTNLPDLLFAFETDNLIYGRANNPYDLSRTPGGSSGGEAALIAACGSPLGLGSDAAGSVRLPGHFCGLAAIKPTSGRLPRTGHVPPAGGWIESLWQIGPMARRVEDLAAVMPLLAYPDGQDFTVIGMLNRDPASVRLKELRIAYFTDNGILTPDAETVAVIERAAAALADEGARIEERRPPGVEQSYDLEMHFLAPGGGDALRSFLDEIGSRETHPLLQGWLQKLEPFRSTIMGFAETWAALDRFRAGMLSFLSDFDAVLSPVSASPAVAHGASIAEDVFPGFSYTMTHNLSGWPAAVVRCGQSAEGLPIGVQIAASPWREDIALAVAGRLEAVFGGWRPSSIL